MIVTPLAGVWIEMTIFPESCPVSKSLPLRECGLKCNRHLSFCNGSGSLPLRECGLKYFRVYLRFAVVTSLPLRECGLKSMQ